MALDSNLAPRWNASIWFHLVPKMSMSPTGLKAPRKFLQDPQDALRHAQDVSKLSPIHIKHTGRSKTARRWPKPRPRRPPDPCRVVSCRVGRAVSVVSCRSCRVMWWHSFWGPKQTAYFCKGLIRDGGSAGSVKGSAVCRKYSLSILSYI